jgi:hypothetical protein
MVQTIDTQLTNMNEGLTALQGAVTLIASELGIHRKFLSRILEILTPDEEPASGPSLHELLAELIVRLDRQSIALKDILVAQRKLARDLPLDVVRIIDDNLGGMDQPSPGDHEREANGGSAKP